MENDLIANLDKLHTTELGKERIRKNLVLSCDDIVAWCRRETEKSQNIVRCGKNWYVHGDGFVLTVNAYSFTIITAHKA